METLEINKIHCGDSTELIEKIERDTVALSFWSPPYFLGKEYEENATFETWQDLLKKIIYAHYRILKPGGFMVINIADILAFQDPRMPKIMGENPANRKSSITRDAILEAKKDHPFFNRYQLAEFLGCSEQTIDRRLNGNNVRGGKYACGTHVKLVGAYLESYAYEAGLYLYDRRIWKKDPAWANSRWTTNTLKAVSETEDLYVFWKPGEYLVNRDRLSEREWKDWGYRQIWEIPSVRSNDIHPAMFPIELAMRVIKLYSDEGEIILDPFVGSGTTALAAIECDRQFIGIELLPKYAKIASEKVSQSMNRLFYSYGPFEKKLKV